MNKKERQRRRLVASSNENVNEGFGLFPSEVKKLEEEGSDRVSGIDDPGEDRGDEEFFPVGFEDAADQKSGREGREGAEAKTHRVRCHRVTDGPVCPSKAYLVPTNPAPPCLLAIAISSSRAQRTNRANLDAE